MSERERLRRFAELSFEISCLMTDPKDAAAARRTGIQYLEDADAADEQQKESQPENMRRMRQVSRH
jgi:hypothetical protein